MRILRSGGVGAFVVLAFGRLVQFALALAATRIATTLLAPEELGRLALVVATTGFFTLLLISPVGMYINRHLHAWSAVGVTWRYLGRYWAYLGVVSALAAVLLVAGRELGILRIEMNLAWLVVLVCASMLFATANQTVIPALNLLGRSDWFLLLSIATAALNLVLSTLLTLVMGHRAEPWLSGTLLGQAALAVAGARLLYVHLKRAETAERTHSAESDQLKQIFAYVWPVAIAVGLGWIQNQSYRYVVERLLGLAPLGLFVAGYGVSMGIIAAYETLLTTYLQPRFYRDITTTSTAQQTEAWQRYASSILPALIFTTISVVALAPELTTLFLGPAFRSASEYIVWGAIAEAMRVVGATYSLLAHARRRTNFLILPSLCGAGAAVALNIWLVPLLGPTGAGIALAVAGLVFVFTIHVVLAAGLKVGLPMHRLSVAAIFGGAIWAIAASGRFLLDGLARWPAVIAILLLAWVAYVAFAYLLLKRYFA